VLFERLAVPERPSGARNLSYRAPSSHLRQILATFEWPTVLLAVAIHAAWLVLTFFHAVVPLPLLALLGGAVVAWHGSLQHETIHGHPTGIRQVDGAIGSAPLSLWLPYAIYRRSHLAHHAAPHITDPLGDPESHYLARAGGLAELFARLEATLLGRMLLGPAIRLGRFLAGEAARAGREPRVFARDWLAHGLALLPLLWWLHWVGLPIGTYILVFVYPGTAISLLRSFAEHRADADPQRRAAIIERPGIFGLLFLNNNLHAVHHARPELAWYNLPKHFQENRASYAPAPYYRSYEEVARRFALTAQDHVVHPNCRVSGEFSR
jgi:fatty acid desaturase